MRSSLLFLLAPAVVLVTGERIVTRPSTGQICCDQGIADPSETCKKQGLNSYCCSDRANDDSSRDGCDFLARFEVGRDVKSIVTGLTCETEGALGDTIVGFGGCAA
ncbi:hypothetical protein LX36DRAFT_659401 [Colletotrichum falcatum]|nr:hypothetical protein LX36DRAFT_659401 [Colletotrichum falcatum]